jgi:L-arabinose isomerase
VIDGHEMNDKDQLHKGIKPRLAVVITTWSHESGADYAANLVHLFPQVVPVEEVDALVCPLLLETELDIPNIFNYFTNRDADALCLVPGNFTLDHVMPLLAEAMKLPTILWGLPTREAWGALVSVQQTLFSFKELGLPFRFVSGLLEDRDVWESILSYTRGAALLKRLNGLRIGLMGWRAQGMSDVIFDELALRKTFGVQLVNIGLTTYTRTLQAIQEEEVDQAWEQIRGNFNTTELPDMVGRYGIRSYLALKEFVSQQNLHALTLECFHDHLGGPCLGFSLLNDQGIAAPCENDIPAAILMAAAQKLTGEATFHTDIVESDYTNNRAVFHHCGNLPLSLVESGNRPGLKPIRETAGPGAYGPTIQATMKPGPVTVANLVSGQDELRLCAMEGEVLATSISLPGSGAVVGFPFSLRQALEKIGNEGYGHHFVLIQGHRIRDLAEWCGLTGVRFVQAGKA